jgi:sigma-B regulation protein RsbU (phosphoserine phosphatase)
MKMSIVSRLQNGLMPRIYPSLNGFGLAGKCLSAQEVGGDFFEVMPLTESSVLMVIADVMGKGITASLFADSLRTLIRALAKPGVSPAQLISEINQLMFEDLSSADMFITLQIATADLFLRRLNVSNAGHCPLLLCDGAGHSRAIAPEGMPLGIQMAGTYEEECARVPQCGAVLLYTDGLTEARNRSGDFFGQHRLEAWLGRAIGEHQTALALRTNLVEQLLLFQEDTQASDDQTFLILSDESPRTALSLMDNGTPRAPIEWPEELLPQLTG